MIHEIAQGLFGGSGERGEYQCRNCGTAYEHRRQVCPACDSYRVERREW